MHVTPPTAWATVRRMVRDGLVELDSRKVVRLTPKGHDLAEDITRRHRLAERFLVDVIGLAGLRPTTRPPVRTRHHAAPVRPDHGPGWEPENMPARQPDPRHGYRLSPELKPLASLKEGEEAAVVFISEELEEDMELMKYLERSKMTPAGSSQY